MPTILFRADAEKSIGIGDLMSLIYLSGEFRRNSWQCFFAVRDYGPALQIVKQRNLNNVYLIPHDFTIKDEIDFIKKICKENSIDCLFMEITKNSLQEYDDLGKSVLVKACANFDGIITEDFDVVVNWCIDSSDDLYREYEGKDIQFIVGFENVILPDYLDWERVSRRAFGNEVKNILISMGGIDEFDVTRKILKALSTHSQDCEIRVITGPGYKKQNDLCQFMNTQFKDITLKHNVDNLFEDYLWADIAFSAGGLTSSELVATKTPAVLIATYEHQVKRCEYYDGKKWAHYAGFHSNLDGKSIIKSLNYLIENIGLFRENLSQSNFRGGNEKIFKCIDLCR